MATEKPDFALAWVARLSSWLDGAALPLLSGGAAVHRCDHCTVFNAGFSRRGTFNPVNRLFPPPSGVP
jgi:hypothetical protein